MIESRREYTSPDGCLRFIIITEDVGDVSLGYDGFSWHTHADLLSAWSGESETVAVDNFLADLLDNRAVIAISRMNGSPQDVWITDNPHTKLEHLLAGETIEFRLWNGKVVATI